MTNCDDLLFNFMVAAKSKRAPVILNTSKVKRMHHLKKFSKSTDGLSHRDEHYTQRDRCLNDFAKAMGGMPLLYTRTAFPIRSAPKAEVPGRDAHDSVNMHCSLCEQQKGTGDGEECVKCALL